MTEPSNYDAVIFDLFGTLVEVYSFRGYDQVLQQMAGIVGAPPVEFAQIWRETLSMRATGMFKSIAGNVEHICGLLNVQIDRRAVKAACQARDEHTVQSLEPRPDAVDVLTRLRRAGCKVGLISDCAPDVPAMWSRTPFKKLITRPIFSCSVGLKKPDPRIYELACKKLKVEPDRCLYVGDGSSRELTGAQKAGMHPVLIRVPYEDAVDAYRPDGDAWDGPSVSSLTEVAEMVIGPASP
jgi:putative hydrolase of the HAD superfamily